MPSLKTIRKRISSVKSTQKITKAMKMVAAAKLRRAQEAAIRARHYTAATSAVVQHLAERSGAEPHPLMTRRKSVRQKEYWIFTSDRGLCGGFNGNLLRRVAELLMQEEKAKTPCHGVVFGKKGIEYFRSKHLPLKEGFPNFYDHWNGEQLGEKVAALQRRYLSGEVDAVELIYNKFRSALVQEVTVEPWIPFEIATQTQVDFLYEPDRAGMVDRVLQTALTAKLQQVILESLAGELAARMTAMDNATSNASDRIDYLTLQFNRARQATITKELMEIVGGAEALGG